MDCNPYLNWSSHTEQYKNRKYKSAHMHTHSLCRTPLLKVSLVFAPQLAAVTSLSKALFSLSAQLTADDQFRNDPFNTGVRVLCIG